MNRDTLLQILGTPWSMQDWRVEVDPNTSNGERYGGSRADNDEIQKRGAWTTFLHREEDGVRTRGDAGMQGYRRLSSEEHRRRMRSDTKRLEFARQALDNLLSGEESTKVPTRARQGDTMEHREIRSTATALRAAPTAKMRQTTSN